MRLGRILGAATGAVIGFLAAPATGGLSLALAAGAAGALSGGVAGSNVDEGRRAGRQARAIAGEQREASARDREYLLAERSRVEQATTRERARLNTQLNRSMRRRFGSSGFLGSGVPGSEVLG